MSAYYLLSRKNVAGAGMNKACRRRPGLRWNIAATIDFETRGAPTRPVAVVAQRMFDIRASEFQFLRLTRSHIGRGSRSSC